MRPPRPTALPRNIQTRLLSTTIPPPLIRTTLLPAPHTGHIHILTLTNPRTRNAISRALLSELSTSLHSIKKQIDDEVKAGGAVGQGARVLIINSGVDEAFCAGADLKERRGMGGEE